MNVNKKNTKPLYNIFFDLCIVGGGASGMAAAINAVETNPTLNVCIIEKKEQLGKKLLATGNGRCNITNASCEELGEVRGFLENSGIVLKEESQGRMYPYSGQAVSVLELLKWRLKTLNITTFTECKVVHIVKKDEKGFDIHVECGGESIFIPCKTVLLACGGKAGPQYGTTGDGYSLAKSFGHHISNVRPVLMPLECENMEEHLKGIRSKGCVRLLHKEKVIAEETGEIQFTEYGLSGICVFNLSRYVILSREHSGEAITMEDAFREYSLEVDFLPEIDEAMIIDLLKERRTEMAGMPTEVFLASLVNMKLGEDMVDTAMKGMNFNIGNISDEGIEEIAMLLKSSIYTLKGARGWQDAQCTGGGVSLEEIDQETMESKKTDGVYFAGELLDYDGPCGGFNLNYAWFTGIKAGRSIARVLTKNQMMGD